MNDIAQEQHYNMEYFNWQKNIGIFGGSINKRKFESFIKSTDKVVDFGSGGGFLLKNVHCQEKIGIELNEAARNHAKSIDIKTVESVADIPNEWADVIISNHALEHTQLPLQILQSLYEKLKKGGKIIFVVPCEHISYQFFPKDINQHIYSWSPMCLGNLFQLSGFHVLECKPYIHKWPPHYVKVYQFLGETLFHIVCKIWARIERSWFQVRVVAIKI